MKGAREKGKEKLRRNWEGKAVPDLPFGSCRPLHSLLKTRRQGREPRAREKTNR